MYIISNSTYCIYKINIGDCLKYSTILVYLGLHVKVFQIIMEKSMFMVLCIYIYFLQENLSEEKLS